MPIWAQSLKSRVVFMKAITLAFSPILMRMPCSMTTLKFPWFPMLVLVPWWLKKPWCLFRLHLNWSVLPTFNWRMLILNLKLSLLVSWQNLFHGIFSPKNCAVFSFRIEQCLEQHRNYSQWSSLSLRRKALHQTEDSMAWSIGLKASFWSEAIPGTELSVLVSSSSVTGQNVIIPIKVNFRGDQCANIEMGWSVLLYFLAAHYQSLIFILASCVICVFITKLMLQNTANAGKSDSSAKPPMERNQNFLNVSPSAMKIHQNGYASPMTSDARPHLWTVNDSPVYGSPTSTSPYNRKSPRSLTQTQYSYDRWKEENAKISYYFM